MFLPSLLSPPPWPSLQPLLAPVLAHLAHLPPPTLVHLAAALAALALGPFALATGRRLRPSRAWHRLLGLAWVGAMLAVAVSAAFLREPRLPNLGGITPVHLLVPATLAGLALGLRRLARGDVAGHRRWMQRLYVGACLVTGGFTLLRIVGQRALGLP